MPIYVMIATLLLGCESPVRRAARELAYQGYEMIGVQKRDLLKRDISATREHQKEAGATFGDALEQLRKLYAMPESQLETQYHAVKSAYDQSSRKADEVRDSRARMQNTARDLFGEWEGEIKQIQAAGLREKSRDQLRASRARFADLDRSLDATARQMAPALGHLKDHVLYLKHNLNAESVSALRKEHDRIDADIAGLLRDVNRAVARADDFANTLR